MAIRDEQVSLDFSPIITHSPVPAHILYNQACQNDHATIHAWRDTWISQVKNNHEEFGPFKDHGLSDLFGIYKLKPCIIAGSGPSLKYNAHMLKDRGDIPLVSCLHNFQYFEDLDAAPQFYVSLDAGPITVEEVYEGGKHPPEYYWERTADRTLLAYIGTHPELLRKWKGKIHFFNCPIPDSVVTNSVNEIEQFHTYVSNGGNVLGACLYLAKVFMGANPVVFIGADFSFGYVKSEKTGNNKFHAWDSKYDKDMGYCIGATDVFGNRIKTWQSYANFAAFFNARAQQVPGIWINATEGGILGAFPEGNIHHIRQMTLAQVFEMYNMCDFFKGQAKEPEKLNNAIAF